MKIIIDATNVGSGGGVTHIKEILKNFDYKYFENKIEKIHVFGSQNLLNQIENNSLIEKSTHPNLNGNILKRLFFQIVQYDKKIKGKYDIVFSITGDYLGSFRPVVGMSRNMLLYERDIWKKINQFKEVFRFWINYQKQKWSFLNSDGIIFLSNYAMKYISEQVELREKQLTIINHGVSSRFIKEVKIQRPISEYSFKNPFKFIYVSTIHVYKNQWNVVKAIGKLRDKGYAVELHIIGSVIFEPSGKKLDDTIRKIDPNKYFIHNHGHVPYENIDKFYKNSDGIIFASTCENMPNTLIESMASGLPIACSNKQPMPEFLKENGFYFDAHNFKSITSNLIEFLDNPKQREINIKNASINAKKFSWEKTSKKTFEFLIKIYQNHIVI